MRFKLLGLIVLVTEALTISGCTTQRCIEEYSTMTVQRAVRRDGEILTALVEKRQAAAEALQDVGDQSSEHADIVFSIQAWEMGIRLIAQLQNLSRREEHHEGLETQRELVSNIRCLARSWTDARGHVIGQRDGQRMLRYQRELETEFGERGRPTDTQLTSIIDGNEIYMGPVEEEIDVPEEEEGTGPGDETPTEEEEGDGDDESEEDDAASAIDDLLGD